MTRVERVLVLAAGVALMAIFTFADLSIAMTLFTKNAFGRVLEVVGELPFAFLAVLAFALLFRFRGRKTKAASIALGIVFAVLLALFASLGGFMAWNYLHENIAGVPQPLALGIAMVLGACAVLLARRVPAERSREAVTYAIIAIAYFIAVIVIMNAIKGIWGRMRIREMTDPQAQFTPWYVITNRGGFDNAYASFPSGHAMNAAGTMLLCLFPMMMPQLAGKRWAFKVASYAWVVLVGSSRVVMGAHFATDVVAGALLSLLLFEVIRAIVFRARHIQPMEGAYLHDRHARKAISSGR